MKKQNKLMKNEFRFLTLQKKLIKKLNEALSKFKNNINFYEIKSNLLNERGND